MAKVLVGMSGGVDSSVTAHLLMQQGFEVEGLSFILWEARNRQSFSACCSLEATNSASQTAEKLGISHTALDVRGAFIDKVIEPFVRAYTKGMTPNPCILCNRYVKFPFLLREADRRGADYIATGHYARVTKEQSEDNTYFLKRGVDLKKDQSYVLYMLGQDALRRLLLPLGDFRKEEVRTTARLLSLAAADRPESQEICFVEDKNYCRFIEQLLPFAGEPGPILDTKGKVLGAHKGIFRYTIGQRKGLGISSPAPFYVIKIDATNNAIHVGSQKEIKNRNIFVEDIHWCLAPGDSSFRATVKVRSMMEAKPAFIELHNKGALVLFDEPQWAPAPGQSAVFYEEDLVLGGGIIAEEMTI